MPFIVVYDANVLYFNTLRDLHIRIARAGMVQAKWTQQILDEALGSLASNHPDISQDKLTRLGRLINESVPDCLVTGYKQLIEGLQLPDPDDRHVLAAAIKSGSQVIVTANLKDFPSEDLRPWHIEVKSPDEFVLDQIGIDSRIVYACVREIANSRQNPPQTVDDILAQLERAGLVKSVPVLRMG